MNTIEQTVDLYEMARDIYLSYNIANNNILLHGFSENHDIAKYRDTLRYYVETYNLEQVYKDSESFFEDEDEF